MKRTLRGIHGMSMIMLEFDFGTDMDAVMNDVRDKVDMISGFLPDGTEDPMILKFSSDMIPVVILSATAEESAGALYKILDEQVANPLNRVSGVGTVSVAGAPQREIQVNVIPDRLEAYQISLEQIAQVIAAENYQAVITGERTPAEAAADAEARTLQEIESS